MGKTAGTRKGKGEADAPLLEVLTRTLVGRERLLGENQASLTALETGPGATWVQSLLPDPVGRGVPWANVRMRREGGRLAGRYVWVLDDDDVCVYPRLVMDLATIVGDYAPDVVMVQMDHGEGMGVLPPAALWGRRALGLGLVGVSAPIVRREVWAEHAWAWGDRYEGDFDFVTALLGNLRLRVYWHPVVASRVQRVSRGSAKGGE